MVSQEKGVFLAIADISGYTRFMLANQSALEHSQMIINALTQALLDHFKAPYQVSKLEGDAVFLYAPTEGEEIEWRQAREGVARQLFESFDVFSDKLLELLDGNRCPCPACRNIEQLRLKIISHAGRALLYRVDRFDELSGPDVIVVHRLLKNSVDADQYLLLTEPAYGELPLPEPHEVVEGKEEYDEIGEIQTYICLRPASEEFLQEAQRRRQALQSAS